MDCDLRCPHRGGLSGHPQTSHAQRRAPASVGVKPVQQADDVSSVLRRISKVVPSDIPRQIGGPLFRHSLEIGSGDPPSPADRLAADFNSILRDSIDREPALEISLVLAPVLDLQTGSHSLLHLVPCSVDLSHRAALRCTNRLRFSSESTTFWAKFPNVVRFSPEASPRCIVRPAYSQARAEVLRPPGPHAGNESVAMLLPPDFLPNSHHGQNRIGLRHCRRPISSGSHGALTRRILAPTVPSFLSIFS